MSGQIQWKENLPAINVKTYRLDFDILPDEAETQAAELLGEEWQTMAWEWLIEDWWAQAEEIAKEVFGPKTEVFRAGRMGGWLQVKGTGIDSQFDDPSEDVEKQRQLLLKWSDFESRIQNHLYDTPEMYKAIVLNEIRKKMEEKAEDLLQKQEDRRVLVQDLVLATRTSDDIRKILDKHLGKVE